MAPERLLDDDISLGGRLVLAALAAIGILLPASRAAAANLDITPSISLDQAYDSNVFNTNGNEKGDFILRATPALTFSLRTPRNDAEPADQSSTSDTYYKYAGIEQHQFRHFPGDRCDTHPDDAQVFDGAFRLLRAGAQLLPSDPTGAHGGPTGPPLDRLGIRPRRRPGITGRRFGSNYQAPTEKTDLRRRGVQQLQFLDNTAGNVEFPGDQRRYVAQLQIQPGLLLGGLFGSAVQHVQERPGLPGVRRRVLQGHTVLPGVPVDARLGMSFVRQRPHIRSAGEHGYTA